MSAKAKKKKKKQKKQNPIKYWNLPYFKYIVILAPNLLPLKSIFFYMLPQLGVELQPLIG